jgi:regulatory protein
LRKRPPSRRRLGAHSAPPADALTAAVGLLARRDFCTQELRLRLAALGCEAEATEAALADLLLRGYLDDTRYAAQYVEQHAARGQGPLRIAHQLQQQGLPEALAQAALEAHGAEHGEWGRLAREVRIRRFGLKPPRALRERARQMRFLQYRGFSNDDIRSAVESDAVTDHDS